MAVCGTTSQRLNISCCTSRRCRPVVSHFLQCSPATLHPTCCAVLASLRESCGMGHIGRLPRTVVSLSFHPSLFLASISCCMTLERFLHVRPKCRAVSFLKGALQCLLNTVGQCFPPVVRAHENVSQILLHFTP